MDFLQSSFSGFFAAKLSRKAVTSTACAGGAAGEEEVAEATGVVLVGAAAEIVLLGAATGAELGAAAGDEDVAEAAGAFGLVGVAAATVVVGEATAGNAARGCYGGVSEYFRHEVGEHSHRGGICAAPGQKASQLSVIAPQLFDACWARCCPASPA